MSLTFERVDEIFKSYGLVSHAIRNELTQYRFLDKAHNKKRRNVVVEVKALLSGEVNGYIYVDHLEEYDNHPDKTKKGHISIINMTEIGLKEIIEKVIKDYR